MKKVIKILIIIFAVVLVLMAASFTAVYLKYNSVVKQNLPSRILKADFQPEDEVYLGNTLNAKLTLQVPWNKYPSEVQLTPSKGSQLQGNIAITREKRKWGYNIWNVDFKVQPYIVGVIPEGKFSITISSNDGKETDTLNSKIPEFKSLEIKSLTNNLFVAGKVPVPKVLEKSRIIYFILAFIILLIVIVLFFVLKKKNQKIKILTCWEKAILSLEELKDKFHHGSMEPLKCIFQLTDIVRNYLEERFEIHAPKQTTVEFLNNMENTNSPLNNKDRNFLREFMVSTDMIKFAKYEANKEMIENSIDRAVQLVNESIPDELVEEPQNKDAIL